MGKQHRSRRLFWCLEDGGGQLEELHLEDHLVIAAPAILADTQAAPTCRP
jgi:hypothetical protein